jgi:hypothetical protein
MSVTQEEMQRQIFRYAFEEWRNRGLEEAAQLAESAPKATGWLIAKQIRALKRDPAAKMTDWWAR